MSISPYNRIFMREAGFCFSDNSRPILATDGLRSCIGFAGWEPEKNLGFLVHFSGPDQVADFAQKGLKTLECMTEGNPSRFICILRGGCSKTKFSSMIIEAIKAINPPNYIKLEITQEDPLPTTFILKSLSLDTRNGVFGKYDPKQDPDPRILTEAEEKEFQDLACYEKLVYRKLI